MVAQSIPAKFCNCSDSSAISILHGIAPSLLDRDCTEPALWPLAISNEKFAVRWGIFVAAENLTSMNISH